MWRDQRDATSDVTSCHVRRSAFVSTHKVVDWSDLARCFSAVASGEDLSQLISVCEIDL